MLPKADDYILYYLSSLTMVSPPHGGPLIGIIIFLSFSSTSAMPCIEENQQWTNFNLKVIIQPPWIIIYFRIGGYKNKGFSFNL